MTDHRHAATATPARHHDGGSAARSRRLGAALLALGSAAAVAGIAAGPALTAQADGSTVTLANSVLHGLNRATLLGPSDQNRVVGIGVSLSRPDPAGEAAYIHSEYDPGSPSYHQFLSPQQFNARFGVPASATGAVSNWLRSAGLRVQAIPGTTDYVVASGTVAQVDRLLSVQVDDYRFQGRTFYAGSQAPTVPAALDIAGITGLNDLEGPRLLPHTGGGQPATRPATVDANTNMGLTTPYDLWSIYDQPNDNKGQGQQLAIFGWGTTDHTLPDLRQFEREYHFPAIPFSVRYIGTESSVTDSGGEGEWNIDTQSSSGMAPDAAALKLYFAKAGTDPDLIGAYSAWVNDPNGPLQGSSSFSGCEEAPGTDSFGSGVGAPNGLLTFSNAMQDDYEAALRQAVAEGRTMFASTGDTGSGCPATSLVVNGATIVPTPQQGYPAVSSYAVGVGGTTLWWDGGGSSPGTGATAVRALETSWTHGGGGTSLFLAAGDYQQNVVGVVGQCISDPHGNAYVPPVLCRGIPDVAAQSGDVTGNGMTITSSGTNDTQGAGTSLSSPLWLGMWTRIQAASKSAAGNGFADESFYKNPGDFFDIGAPGSTETASTCNGLNCSHLGWDYTSGLGTPDVAKLMSDIDGGTAPRISPSLQPMPPPPAPDPNTHGGTTCPGPQIVADDPTGSSDANNTPGGSGAVPPNYDIVNASFSQPDPSTLRVRIAVKDLEGSPDGTADANLGDVFLSVVWNMDHSENNQGSTVSFGDSTLTDSSRTGTSAWTTNEWAGGTVTVDGQVGDVVSNTSDTLTLFDNWAPKPGDGSSYTVEASTPYFALANSQGPGPAAQWSFDYGQYTGNLFNNQIAAKSTSTATNGVYAGGDAGTVQIDIPIDATIGGPVPGSVLENVRADSNGSPPGDVVYWTAPVDTAPDEGHGAPYVIDQVCTAGSQVEAISTTVSGGAHAIGLPNTSAVRTPAGGLAVTGLGALLVAGGLGRRRRRRAMGRGR